MRKLRGNYTAWAKVIKNSKIEKMCKKVTEEIVIKLSKSIARNTGQKNLCLAGGVALNCVANGALIKENLFDNIWIQPAAGDAGGALGAALGAYYIMLDKPRKVLENKDAMQGSFLGPSFNHNESKQRLSKIGAKFKEYDDYQIIKITAQSLAEGKTIGWMDGRMEFGPRALGARSIIADPRSPNMQKQLNLKIKYRESFRPFAPSILREDLTDWFEINIDSPYMLFVADIIKEKQHHLTQQEKQLFGIEKLNIKRSDIPAVTHIDYSARIQTVHKETNSRYHELISQFKKLTGCPIIINTSFNVRGEPIVCTPEDAFRCFMGTELDMFVINNLILKKEDQNLSLQKNYIKKYALD